MSNKVLVIDTVTEITINNHGVTKLWTNENSYVELSQETVHKCAQFFTQVWSLVAPPEENE